MFGIIKLEKAQAVFDSSCVLNAVSRRRAEAARESIAGSGANNKNDNDHAKLALSYAFYSLSRRLAAGDRASSSGPSCTSRSEQDHAVFDSC